MGLHTSIIRMLEARQARARLRRRGALGDFHRAGGAALLEDMPVSSDDVVIDGGGFEGNWTAAMLVRSGCSSVIFEPVPSFATACRARFARNARVTVHEAALGGTERTARFAIDSLASSEHRARGPSSVDVPVIDASEVIRRLADRYRDVACLKLNIEGGEYEVLERLLGDGTVLRCRSILVQFHAQPDGWQARMADIHAGLARSHEATWRFPMVWELWTRR